MEKWKMVYVTTKWCVGRGGRGVGVGGKEDHKIEVFSFDLFLTKEQINYKDDDNSELLCKLGHSIRNKFEITFVKHPF